MNVKKIASVGLLTLVAVGSVAGSALAGTEATNSREWRRIYRGYSRSNTTVNIEEIKKATNRSVTVKAESYGGNRNVAEVKLRKNGKISAKARSVRNDRQDPVAIITKATQFEQVDTTTNIAVDAFERYNFSGGSSSHTVSSDSF